MTILAQKLVDSRKNIAKNNPEKEKQFFDINFHNLIHDPIGTVKNIYAHFGYEFTDEYEQKIQEYLKSQEGERKSRASYTISELEVTEEYINERFAPYIAEYSKYF